MTHPQIAGSNPATGPDHGRHAGALCGGNSSALRASGTVRAGMSDIRDRLAIETQAARPAQVTQWVGLRRVRRPFVPRA